MADLAVVPSELIDDNGQVLRSLIKKHVERQGWGEQCWHWIEEHVHFYDTLVDRIVAGYPSEAEELWEEVGYQDNALVKGEYFSLWAVGGDDYLQSLLPLDQLDVGVQFLPVEQIAPFRDKKVRILNGAHTALAQVGLQMGADTVGEAFAIPLVRVYIDELIYDEVLPTIDEDPAELRKFAEGILERFLNPYLHHHLRDIELNSISKWKARNLPVLLDRAEAGLESPRTLFALAALLALYSGRSDVPNFVPTDNPGVAEFISEALSSDDVIDEGVAAIISKYSLCEGASETLRDQVVTQTSQSVRRIFRVGMPQTLKELLERA